MNNSDSDETGNQLSEALPDEQETTQIFREYRKMLRATGNEASVYQKRLAGIETLSHLLPPGRGTVFNVNIFTVLAKNGKMYHLNVPLSLASDGTKAKLLQNDGNGRLRTQSMADLETAPKHFLLLNKELDHGRLDFPRFTHKIMCNASTLHYVFATVEEAWNSNISTEQTIQQFVIPSAKQPAVVRAHWVQANPHTIYYILAPGAKPSHTPPCLAKILPELSQSFSNPRINEPTVTVLSSGNTVIKKTTPIPDIDSSIQECIRAISDSGKIKKVTQIVCDFVCSREKKWVLLSCQGYTFTSHRKAISQVIEPSQPIDMKFMMFPVFAREASLRKLRIAHQTPNDISALRRRSIMFEFKQPHMDDLYPSTPEPATIRHVENAPKVLLTKPLPVCDEFDNSVRQYDRIRSSVEKFQLGKIARLDFISQYGGDRFWDRVLDDMFGAFVSEEQLMKYYGHLNFEERRVIQRGFRRVIQGNYNFYYEDGLTVAHSNKGITAKDYDSFIERLRSVLIDVPISKQDLEVILKRFTDLKDCICSKAK